MIRTSQPPPPVFFDPVVLVRGGMTAGLGDSRTGLRSTKISPRVVLGELSLVALIGNLNFK